jgi:mitochondrial splicing suppressor protein 51
MPTSADSVPQQRICGGCGKTEAEAGKSLKKCAKCHASSYCSRECQKSDWKQHKKTCGSKSSDPGTDAAAPVAAAPGVTTRPLSSTGSSTKNLDTVIDKPFQKLQNKTWLHDRSENDVFKLLIDSYRMRMVDDHTFTGDVDNDSIYGGANSGELGFHRFMREVTKKPGLLPSWWTAQKLVDCLQFGRSNSSSNLSAAVEKSDIQETYGNPDMPMQLRMFAEQVYGTGPGGHNGAAMMAMKAAIEDGQLGAYTQLDLSR